jgi:hypothetical protein
VLTDSAGFGDRATARFGRDALDQPGVRTVIVLEGIDRWIRTGGEYDVVADLDRAMGDPADPDPLNPAYDSGDGLHPNDAGLHRMAQTIDLDSL